MLNLVCTTLSASAIGFFLSATVRIFAIANLLIALCYVFMMVSHSFTSCTFIWGGGGSSATWQLSTDEMCCFVLIRSDGLQLIWYCCYTWYCTVPLGVCYCTVPLGVCYCTVPLGVCYCTVPLGVCYCTVPLGVPMENQLAFYLDSQLLQLCCLHFDRLHCWWSF